MKSLKVVFWVFTAIVALSVVMGQLDAFQYRSYDLVYPTELKVEQKLDDEEMLNLLTMGHSVVDPEWYDYYVVTCTLQNDKAVDGSYSVNSAFYSNPSGSICSVLESLYSEGQQYAPYYVQVPAGDSVQIRMVLEVEKDAQTVSAWDNDDLIVSLG